MPEMWGHCEGCDKWFYVPFDTGPQMAAATCPVCLMSSDRFEIRSEDTSFVVELPEDSPTA